MNCKAFQTRILSVAALAMTLGGCWSSPRRTKNTEDFAFFKSAEAQEACLSSNLSQWELTGTFLHDFFRCASNKSADGGETLPGIQGLLDHLSADQLQKLLDFVLTVDPKGATHEEQYPYLLATTTLLDRGLLDAQTMGLSLTTERLSTLQDFLVTLDVTRSREILSTWSRSGRLAEVLNEMGLFIKQLDDNSIEVASRELLAGTTVRPEFLPMAQTLLKQDAFFQNLSDLLEQRQARVLSPAEQGQFLNPYRETTTTADAEPLHVAAAASTTDVTPAQQLANEHKQYSPTELGQLKSFILSFWTSYQALGSSERQSLDSRLSAAMSAIGHTSANSMKWALAFLHDMNTDSAADLQRITYSFDELLQDGGNISLEAIRAKAGATKLTNNLLRLISQGGSISGCAVFDKPQLTGDMSYEQFASTLNALSKPSDACSGRIPLVAAIEQLTAIKIGSPCDGRDNCLDERAPLATSQDLWSGAASVNPGLLKQFTLDGLNALNARIAADPYLLYSLRLARTGVSPEFMQALIQTISQQTDWSLDAIATLDDALVKAYPDVLHTDFLERLYTYRTEILASQSYQFQDLAPDAEAEIDVNLEGRSSRVFAGLYPGGPMEQLYANHFDLSRFTFASDEQDLKQYLIQHPSVWNRMMAKAKEADGMFRWPALGGLSGEASAVFSGPGASLRNYLSFDAQTSPAQVAVVNATSAHRILNPTQAIRSFGDDDQGHAAWSHWAQHFASGPLVAKDVPAALTVKLQNWLMNSFIPTVSDPGFWPELNDSDYALGAGLSRDYFDVQDYTPGEARLISIYYLQQYQKPGMSFPADIVIGKNSAPKSDLTPFADPIRGLFNASYLVKDDYEAQYTMFAKYFPDVLKNETKVSALKNGLLPDYATFSAQTAAWDFAEQAQANDATRLASDHTSPFSLLSTLNLLTYSKPQTKFYPQSVVGFKGHLCHSKTKDPANAAVIVETETGCPLDFQGATDEEAYGKFKEFIGHTAVQSLCPLLASDDFGPRMVWSQRLGLTLDDQSLCAKATPSAFAADVFPAWHSSRVLNDIFTMGKKASLKPGLAQLPSAIRYYKLKHQNLPPERFAAAWLQKAKGLWSETNGADQRRREFFAGNLWAGAPNILDSYLNLLTQQLDPFSWRTVLISYAERTEQGEQRDTLRDILRLFSSEQKLAAANGESMLRFGLNIFDKIDQQPEFRHFLANFFGSLNTSSAYDFYSNELLVASVGLFPADENPFEWSNPGIAVTKFVAQYAANDMWQTLGEEFTADEFERFMTQYAAALRVVPDLDARTSLAHRFLAQVLDLGTLYLPDEKSQLSERLETLAVTWSNLSLGDDFRSHWTNLVTALSQPIQGLAPKTLMSGEAVAESWLGGIIQRGPTMLATLQSAGTFVDPLFWRNWAQGILQTIHDQGDGAVALANFMDDKRFEFDTGRLWLPIFESGDLQTKAVTSIQVMDSVPETVWKTALLEATDLSARLVRALGFLRSHIVWKIDPDHNAFRIALDEVFELAQNQNLRDKQVELVTLWLRDNLNIAGPSGDQYQGITSSNPSHSKEFP